MLCSSMFVILDLFLEYVVLCLMTFGKQRFCEKNHTPLKRDLDVQGLAWTGNVRRSTFVLTFFWCDLGMFFGDFSRAFANFDPIPPTIGKNAT